MVVCLPALEQAVKQAGALREQWVPGNEGIELVAVHGKKGLAFVYPLIALTDRKAEKIMGDSGQQVIMVSCHPDHLNVAFWCTERPEIGEEVPVLAW